MKIIVFIAMFFSFLSPAKSAEAESWARSYIVMEQASGKVLEGKDVNLTRSVASISKIMTAILAIESDNLFDIVTVGDEIKEAVGSSLYLDKGAQITVIDLVYGLLLRSGNDAAMVIAKAVSGSKDAFVAKMNERALELGMKRTTFNNPHGLDINDDGNLSTSYDMALLMRHCLNNDMYRMINNTKSYKSPLKGIWYNKHKLIQSYDDVTGGKTGYTVKAKRTLITSAKKDNLELIVVTIDCGGDFALHRSMFEKYFKKYIYLIFLYRGMNKIEGFIVNVDHTVGIMIERALVPDGTLLYAINPEENKLTMSFITKSKTVIDVGTIKVVSFSYESKSKVR